MNNIKLAALVTGSIVAGSGGAYLTNNASKKDDLIGRFLMVGGVFGLGVSGYKMAENIHAAKTFGKSSNRMVAAAAAASVAAGGAAYAAKGLAGGGDARPWATVDRLVDDQAASSARRGEPVDKAALHDQLAQFDRYDKHGAEGGDGKFAYGDLPALTAFMRTRADAKP